MKHTVRVPSAATIDASIVIISMPAIFRGIGLNPLTAGNVIFDRVRIYNLGFVVFTLASIALTLCPA